MSTQITHICAVRTAKPTDYDRAQNGGYTRSMLAGEEQVVIA